MIDEAISVDTQFDKNTQFHVNTFYVTNNIILAEIYKRKFAYDSDFN